jgi:CheY-like chemotaxis protein/HPt (histidine-containing phosphotransfer) domain-containing protein
MTLVLTGASCFQDPFPVRFGVRAKIKRTKKMRADHAKTHPTVLVVDDDPISMAIVTLLLASEDFPVLRAADGLTALEILARHRAEGTALPTVLVDLHMPGVSGFDLARHEATHPSSRPRLVAMSATEVDPERLRDFDDFLLKPIHLDLLRASLSAAKDSVNSGGTVSGVIGDAGASARRGFALDQSTLAKLRAIMPAESIRELYSTYVTDTRTRIEQLELCAVRDDADGMRRCAHMLKGSAAMAGVRTIAEIAAAFELGMVAKKNHKSLFHELRIACDDVEQSFAERTSEE